MKTWNVLYRGRVLGTVHETTEEYARCAALHKYGLDDEEWSCLKRREKRDVNTVQGIPPNHDFDVVPQ